MCFLGFEWVVSCKLVPMIIDAKQQQNQHSFQQHLGNNY